MPFVATLMALTTVHANRDLLATEETAAKVRLLSVIVFVIFIIISIRILYGSLSPAFAQCFVRITDSLIMMYKRNCSQRLVRSKLPLIRRPVKEKRIYFFSSFTSGEYSLTWETAKNVVSAGFLHRWPPRGSAMISSSSQRPSPI